ncbi:hypothetical protein GGX14DRAFT_404125 [Mycena pura]|uniref:Uncharacterized protein n=1 Tax=Mycena pura TaxID=153505 RepID=A0AAD6Y5L7_9AGAR|nr:hypothetical protein GGX14DRAFT_404125 [Mycena pura]
MRPPQEIELHGHRAPSVQLKLHDLNVRSRQRVFGHIRISAWEPGPNWTAGSGLLASATATATAMLRACTETADSRHWAAKSIGRTRDLPVGICIRTGKQRWSARRWACVPSPWESKSKWPVRACVAVLAVAVAIAVAKIQDMRHATVSVHGCGPRDSENTRTQVKGNRLQRISADAYMWNGHDLVSTSPSDGPARVALCSIDCRRSPPPSLRSRTRGLRSRETPFHCAGTSDGKAAAPRREK